LPLALEIVTILSGAELAERIGAGDGPDLLLVSQATLDEVTSRVPDGIAAERTVL
jgi:hypothetical protein